MTVDFLSKLKNKSATSPAAPDLAAEAAALAAEERRRALPPRVLEACSFFESYAGGRPKLSGAAAQAWAAYKRDTVDPRAVLEGTGELGAIDGVISEPAHMIEVAQQLGHVFAGDAQLAAQQTPESISPPDAPASNPAAHLAAAEEKVAKKRGRAKIPVVAPEPESEPEPEVTTPQPKIEIRAVSTPTEVACTPDTTSPPGFHSLLAGGGDGGLWVQRGRAKIPVVATEPEIHATSTTPTSADPEPVLETQPEWRSVAAEVQRVFVTDNTEAYSVTLVPQPTIIAVNALTVGRTALDLRPWVDERLVEAAASLGLATDPRAETEGRAAFGRWRLVVEAYAREAALAPGLYQLDVRAGDEVAEACLRALASRGCLVIRGAS